MAHFRLWARWGGVSQSAMPVGKWNEAEQMRAAAHRRLDDLLREVEQSGVMPTHDGDYRKLEMIINVGEP